MASGDELKKSLAAEATKYISGIETRDVATEQGTSAELAAYAALTEKKPATKPSAHRSAITTPDTGDISSATGALDVGNSMHCACYVDFDDLGASAQIALALFTADDDLIGITEFNIFTADSSWRDGAAGPYVSPRYIFDCAGVSKVKAICKSLSAGASANIFLVAL